MGWYVTRSVYLFGIKKSGKNIFEERVVSFQASDLNEARIKADKESKEYASDCEFELYDEQIIYKRDVGPLIDGYELWSELYESDKSLNEFYEDHYKKYAYDPDTD